MRLADLYDSKQFVCERKSDYVQSDGFYYLFDKNRSFSSLRGQTLLRKDKLAAVYSDRLVGITDKIKTVFADRFNPAEFMSTLDVFSIIENSKIILLNRKTLEPFKPQSYQKILDHYSYYRILFPYSYIALSKDKYFAQPLILNLHPKAYRYEKVSMDCKEYRLWGKLPIRIYYDKSNDFLLQTGDENFYLRISLQEKHQIKPFALNENDFIQIIQRIIAPGFRKEIHGQLQNTYLPGEGNADINYDKFIKRFYKKLDYLSLLVAQNAPLFNTSQEDFRIYRLIKSFFNQRFATTKHIVWGNHPSSYPIKDKKGKTMMRHLATLEMVDRNNFLLCVGSHLKQKITIPLHYQYLLPLQMILKPLDGKHFYSFNPAKSKPFSLLRQEGNDFQLIKTNLRVELTPKALADFLSCANYRQEIC